MKKIMLFVFAIFVTSAALVSCGGGSPKEPAGKFINAMMKMDYQGAKEYASVSTKNLLDQMQEEINKMGDDQKKTLKEEMAKRSNNTATIQGVKDYGDKATVTFITSANTATVDSLHMIKENGKWVAELR